MKYYDAISQMNYDYSLDIEGVKIYLCHYPFVLKDGVFQGFIDLAESINCHHFIQNEADIYVFGHQHKGSELIDKNGIRYINLSSAGATQNDKTTYAIIEIENNGYKVFIKSLNYDKSKVIEKIERLKVPKRDFIKKIFYGVKEK